MRDAYGVPFFFAYNKKTETEKLLRSFFVSVILCFAVDG